MADLDNAFIDNVLGEPLHLLQPLYLVEIFTKFGRHRPSNPNGLPVHENGNGVQMIKIHKDLTFVITLGPNTPPNLTLSVGVRLTFPLTDKAGMPLSPSGSVRDLQYNVEDGTFTFVLHPEYSSRKVDSRSKKGPRPVNDPNAFTLVLTLTGEGGEVLDISELNFGAFANPNSREKAKRGLSVVPCFLNTGLSTLTEASKDEFLRGAIFPHFLPVPLYLPEVEQRPVDLLNAGFVEEHQIPSPTASPTDSLDVDSFLTDEPSSPFSFEASPSNESLFPDQDDFF